MKVQVKYLEANPYRNLDKYEIDPYKVDALVTCINETGFWDNILARSHPTKECYYQIAYGHHRLEAIKKAGLKEIDIPVKDLSDSMMIKIMANENLDDWKLNPKVINESVRVAKEYLDNELDKCGTLEDLKLTNRSISKLFKNQQAFSAAKRKDKGKSGAIIIKDFLGGNWKQWMIQGALNLLKEEKEIREAAEVFKTQTDATEFRKVIKSDKFKGKIKKGEEKKIAEKVAKKIEEKKDKIKKEVKENRKRGVKTDNIRGHSHREDMKVFTTEVIDNVTEKEARIDNIESQIEKFKERMRGAYIGTRDLNILLIELEIDQLGGLKSLFVLQDIRDLLEELKKTLSFFGYNYKNLQIEKGD